ncbi:hypothetical protein N7492_004478 [Penicillium capsulatum]|uniref:Lysine-specific metallo-endopeptidase domain-containing protein n=1 Tax=Penicillium capsulatum TaxID=69766 RepID=A0A9W9I7X2_9EURO|nr:hypothetical protein N7492_004478 [Penicillium capsulatum]KAJ6136403.1 hypothetical protein N7512_001563 [Penicillium capsulatum]
MTVLRLLFLIELWGLFACVWGDWSPVPIGTFARTTPANLAGTCVNKGIERDIEDAKLLVGHAIDVIAPMIAGTVQRDQAWINRFDMAKAMFHIEYIVVPGKKNPNEERLKVSRGLGILREATHRYKVTQSRLQNGPSRSGRRFILQCGDADLKWATKLGDLRYIGKDAGKSLMEKVRLTEYPGLFFARSWSPVIKAGKNPDKSPNYAWDYKKAIYLIGGQGSTRRSFCESIGDAASWQTERFRDQFDGSSSSLVLCYTYFRLKGLAAAQQMQTQVGGDLDKLTTRGGVLVHEFMHITTNNIVTDKLISVDGVMDKAYGFRRCYALAKAERNQRLEANRALLNADVYRLFAEGVYFNEVNWLREREQDC